jgi:hypothetical protein
LCGAYELLVFGEGDVAFNDACTLAPGGFVCFQGVLWVLEGSAAVGKAKVGRLEVLFRTALELLLQRALIHVVDQVVWPVAHLDVELLVAMVGAGSRLDGWYCSCGSQSKKDG